MPESAYKHALKGILLAPLVCILTACFLVKARPAADTGFLPHGDIVTIAPYSRSPFNALYYADKSRFASLKATYNKVLVLPINVDMVEQRIMRSRSIQREKDRRIDEVRETARYMKRRIVRAFERLPKKPFEVVQRPESGTFILDLALVEVVPTNAAVNIIATVASAFVPGTGALKIVATGSVAMEGMIRDGASSEVLVEFKDREKDKTAPFTIKDFREYAHIRQTIDEWAQQMAKFLSRPVDSHIGDSLWFTLSPI